MAVPAPPTGDRFAVVTSQDHGAPLIIVTLLSLIFAVLTFAIRIFIVKWKRHGHDDTVLGLGHLVALGHWIAMFVALYHGLGKALEIVTEHDQRVMAMAAFAGRILLMPALCLSKISVLIVLRHLFHYESRRKLLVVDITILAVAAWGFAATVVLSANCSPHYLVGNGQCVNQMARVKGVIIAEIITEAAVFALSPLFLYSFDIALKTKVLVVSAFCFRLPLIPLSTFYLLTQLNYLTSLTTSNASAVPNTVTAVPNLIYQEILISYALISATIPCMKAFMEGFTTGGVGYIQDPNAGRIPTKTTFGSGRSEESEESYELKGVGGKGVAQHIDGDVDAEGRDRVVDGTRRMSARLSRAWNGPGGGGEELDSQSSEARMLKRGSGTDREEMGDVRLLGERS